MGDSILPTYETLGNALVYLAKKWRTLRRKREAEFDEIANAFGDPKCLARYYVEPDCQRHNPADVDEDDPICRHRSPMWRSLARFLSEESPKRDGRNQLFVLSDAGMGKTSLLVMLKLTHLNRFWPANIDFVLKKIGPNTLDEARAIASMRNTVLLLDSLDEYRDAWGGVPTYLAELLTATRHFRHVIVTCRTQFFPKVVHPEANPDLVVLSGFQCPVEYLSPFDKGQVDAFLNKVYPNGLQRRLAHRLGLAKLGLVEKDNKDLTKARGLVEPMRSLRCRPMLLSHIDDLMNAPSEKLWNEFTVYRALVEQWWLREERKNKISRSELENACSVLAIELSRQRVRELPEAQFQLLRNRHPALTSVPKTELAGRSLLNTNSSNDYRFSHYSIQEYLAVASALKLQGELRTRLRDIPVTDQMLRFARAWVDGEPLAPGSWGDKAANMSLGELADNAEALRRGLLLRVAARDWGHGGKNNVIQQSPPDPTEVPRLEPLGRKPVEELDLRERVLDNGDFRGAYLSRAILCRARLRGTRLTYANLTDADLTGADLTGADLTGADLTGAHLQGADRTGTKIVVSGYELAWVPGGVFTMGSPESAYGSTPDESPQHKVELVGFWLGTCPVTNEEYARFLKANPKARRPDDWNNSDCNAPRQPVVGISWDEAVEFCNWAGLVLPTEAQWEYACRAGTVSRYWSGYSDIDAARVAWNSANSGGRAQPVGKKQPNEFGLYDMHGNVWEWCQDSFGSYNDPVRPGDGLRSARDDSTRVLRGGCFGADASYCHSAYRSSSFPGNRSHYIGLRPARVI